MAFEVTRVRQDGIVRLRLSGELDLGTAPELTTVTDDLAGQGEHRILVDLTALTFCDSTGLAAFVRGDNVATASGGWLRVTGATGRVARILEISGLADLLRYDDDRPDPAVVPGS